MNDTTFLESLGKIHLEQLIWIAVNRSVLLIELTSLFKYLLNARCAVHGTVFNGLKNSSVLWIY